MMDYGLSGVFVVADWMDGEVDIPEQTLTNAQVFALLRMTEALRSWEVFETVREMKRSIASYDLPLCSGIMG